MSTQFKQKQFTNLDFFDARNELIDFLKSKTEFQDLNYEGPAMRILVDALAYTTHQLALYANMSLTECFLDSAQIRGSVVSHAKAIGYTPRSRTSSNAYVDLVVTSDTGRTDLYIPEYSEFTSQSGNVSYSFYNPERVELTETVGTPGEFTTRVEIAEGQETQMTFVYETGNAFQRITIPNREIDKNYLRLSSQSGTRKWVEASTVIGLTDESDVFFVQEGPDGFFEIYFGDGVIGSEPNPSEEFVLIYYVSKGEKVNGVATFDFLDSVLYSGGAPSVLTVDSVETYQKAEGGSERESMESIRTNSVISYRAQNRSVTKYDYKSLLQSKYGFIQSISVWGGEENDPPYYGKVFVSIKPTYGDFLSTILKERIKSETIETLSIVGITPEIVDPDLVYIDIHSDIVFRGDLTPLTNSQLVNLVTDSIEDYFDVSVTKYDSVFRFSRLSNAVDEANESIVSNSTSIKLRKKFKPTPSTLQSYTLNFNNEIVSGTVVADNFSIVGSTDAYSIVDSVGKLDLHVNGVLSVRNVGTVDYVLGKLVVNNYVFPVASNTQIEFVVTPKKTDVFTVRNNIISLNLDDSTFSVERVTS